MQTKNLFDICNPKQWKTLSTKDLIESGYPVYGAGGVIGYWTDYNHDKETLIIGCRGSCGNLMITERQSYINGNAMALDDLNTSLVDIKYLYYYLLYRGLDDTVTGGVQKQITRTSLKNVFIPIPPLETQKNIVDVLDKAQGLIDARKEQIRLMDELIQSVFYEMFGDPVKNSYDHPLMAFDKISDSRLGKMLDKKQITGEHLKKYLGNSNVRWFEFDLSDLKEMDFNERDREKFQLRKGDLIICEGGEIGRCAIWQEEVEDCFYQKALHRVRLNSKIVLPEYIQYVLWFYSKRGGFKDYGTSATISHLTGAKLKKMKVPIPPMEEQLKFKNFLIKKQFELDEIKKAYELYQELYASLMNSYLNINGIGGS